MADDKRIDTLREFLQRFFRGDLPGALSLFHEDVRYRIPGQTFLSGEFRSRDQVSRHLQEFKQFTNGTGDIVKWEDWLVGLEYVAAVTTTHMQHPGSLMTCRSVFVAAFSEDGLIEDFEVFFSDERALERFAAGWNA